MHPSPLLSLLFLSIPSVRAFVTSGLLIDDTNTSSFTWSGAQSASDTTRIAITPATPCTTCLAPAPQPTSAHNGTYHIGHQGSTGSLSFEGTAVTVYGINVNNGANISFTLDDTLRTYFYYDGADMYTYHAPFFDAENLAAKNHTVSWVLGVGSGGGSAAIFDYAFVAEDGVGETGPITISVQPTQSAARSAESAASNTPSSGAIAGIVIGALVFSILVGIIGLCLWRRHRRRQREGEEHEKDISHRVPIVRPFTQLASPASARSDKRQLSSKYAPHTDGGFQRDSYGPEPRTPAEEILSSRLTALEARVDEHLPPSYPEPIDTT
ncbi:hypothetical protein C8R44DRAFT_862430 [Mycena epipterygia]|nr:hypothetical protein C8R44DRAFT_862430 [Mycena epipterygia]